MKKTLSTKFLTAIFLIFTGLVLADTVWCFEETVFFQKTYTRGNGKPQVISDSFSVPQRTGDFRLLITNGANGKNRVSSAIVRINDIQILGPSDFNQQVDTINKPIALTDTNKLQVEIRSAPGSFITLSITAAIRMTNVPDVTGLPQADARSAITAAHLTIGAITTANSATVPPGSIINQDPLPGSSVPEGSLVNLLVSLGPVLTTVPNVVGRPQGEAQSAIIAAGLNVGSVTSDYHRTIPAGSVMSQDPASGSKVAPGTSVHLVISLGSSWRQVGPQGGILEFPNGVILDIPAGAVTEETEIEVTDIQCQQVDVILSAHLFTTHSIRCLGGFTGKPDGQVFLLPVKATVPVLPLKPGEIPIQIEVDLGMHKYRLSPTNLTYLGYMGLVEMEIWEFSAPVAGGMSTDQASDYTVPPPSCCFQYPIPITDPPCCCLLDVYIVSDHSSLDGKNGTAECTIAAAKYTTILTMCPGQPQQDSWVQEQSEECPKDMKCQINVDPSVMNLFVCQESDTPTVSLSCESKDGAPIPFTGIKFMPFWNIDNEFAASVDPRTGKVKGLKEGIAKVEANMAIPDDRIIPGKVVVNVRSNIRSFSVTPLQETIKVGEGVTLQAKIVGADGNPLDSSTVNWESSNPSIAAVNQGAGASIVVVGEDCGTVIIFANYKYECEIVQTWATITVEGRVSSCQVNPPAIPLSVGEFALLQIIPLDANGNKVDVDPNTVRWSSSIPDIASVSPSDGLLTGVLANGIGDSIITATYSWSNRCGQKSCQAQATVDCENCTFQVKPSSKVLTLGIDTITLTAELRDKNGDLVNILSPSTVTWASDSNSVSLSASTRLQTTVTPNYEGAATITATYTDMFGQKTAWATITVIAPPKAWDNLIQIGKFENMKLGADGQGHVYAAWQERVLPEVYHTGPWPNTFYKDIFIGRVGSMQITPITTCEVSSDYVTLVAFFVDKMGNMIVVYETRTIISATQAEFETWAKRYNVGSGWDDTSVLIGERDFSIVNLPAPSIAADSSGNAIIVTNDSGIIRALRYDVSQGWQPIIPLAQTRFGSLSPRIAMDPRGNAIVAWPDIDYSNSNYPYEITTLSYRAESGWDEKSRWRIPLISRLESFDILMDSKGNAIVIWYNPDVGIRAKHYDISNGWQLSFIRIADNPRTTFLPFLPYYVSMDESGNAMIIYWQGPTGEESLMSKGYRVGKGWDATAVGVLSMEDVFPTIDPNQQDHGSYPIIAFSMHGEGHATLIIGRYVTTGYSFKTAADFYIDARQYRPGDGWDGPALNTVNREIYRCTDPYGRAHLQCSDDQFQWLNPGTVLIDRYGNATAVMVWINGHMNFRLVCCDERGNSVWFYDHWEYDDSEAIVMQFE